MIKRLRPTNVFFLIIILVITLLLYPEKKGSFNDYRILAYSFLSFFSVVIFFFNTNRVYKSWLRFDTLFLLGYLIVHFQIPFLAALGVEPERANWVWVNISVVNYVVWLSTMILLVWLIGFSLYLTKNKVEKIASPYFIDLKSLDFILFTIFSFFLVLVGKDFLGGSYSGVDNWGPGSTYAYLIFRIILFLRIIYFFINYRDYKITKTNILIIALKNKVLFTVATLSILIFLAAGDRGFVMQIGLIILGGYTLYQKKISFQKFLFITMIGAIVFSVVKSGRTRDASNRNSNILVEGYQNLKDNDDETNPTNELANSIRILNRAVDVVPNEQPYLYGSTLFFNIISVIPLAGSTYMDVTGIPLMYTSSTYFFTILAKGQFFDSGEGSEIIADLYINIGATGAIIVMFFFGYFVSFITYNSFFTMKHETVIIFLVMITVAVYLNRAPFFTPLKDIVWALVFDRLLVKKIYT